MALGRYGLKCLSVEVETASQKGGENGGRAKRRNLILRLSPRKKRNSTKRRRNSALSAATFPASKVLPKPAFSRSALADSQPASRNCSRVKGLTGRGRKTPASS